MGRLRAKPSIIATSTSFRASLTMQSAGLGPTVRMSGDELGQMQFRIERKLRLLDDATAEDTN